MGLSSGHGCGFKEHHFTPMVTEEFTKAVIGMMHRNKRVLAWSRHLSEKNLVAKLA
jgi:hypothetical protein